MVSVSAASRVTAGPLGSRLPQVRLIACRSSGYDNIDLAYARAHRIAVSNPGHGYSPATAAASVTGKDTTYNSTRWDSANIRLIAGTPTCWP